MKRIAKNTLTLILIFLIPAGILNAQDKKEEKHIKIIVADQSGKKVEIDTLIKGAAPDSIKLKNGEVIVLVKDGHVSTVKHLEGEKGEMYVMVTSDDKADKADKADKEKRKEIRIISGDSEHVISGGEGCNIIIVKGGKHLKEGKSGNVVAWSSSSSSPQQRWCCIGAAS